MRVRIYSSADRLARALAIDVSGAIRRARAFVLGLPTGRTPVPFYRELIRLHRLGRVSFARVATFNLDEFVGLSPRDPRSYHAFMRRHLFDDVDLRPAAV